jgi:predicted Fe-S protein YdhL (DUF1289 family)
MRSPCKKVCLMDPASDLCRGCFRTLDEIARWASMSDEEREKIFLLLEERRRNEKSDIPEIPVPPLS